MLFVRLKIFQIFKKLRELISHAHSELTFSCFAERQTVYVA